MKKKNIGVRILAGLLLLVVVAVVVIILYLRFFLPSVPLEEVKVPSSSDYVVKGNYLANHVMVCMDCHSTRDWSRFSGPPVAGTLGKGGEIFDQKMGFPGSFASPNITPYRMKDWSDAEIFRAVTSGVTKEGKALFPIMPYPYYGALDKEDILAVIAYLRTIPPIESSIPPSDPSFPMNLVLNTLPGPAAMTSVPYPSDTLAYGRYIVQAAGCVECHTVARHGQIEKDKAFAGGREFLMPDGTELISSNLTPDVPTGLGNWTAVAWIFRFKSYDPSVYQPPVLKKGELQTIMPWTMYAGMDTLDLLASFRYLQSLKPVKNTVTKIIPAKK